MRPAATWSIRARLLMLVASVLVPALVAAIVLIAWAYRGEQQAVSNNLRDTARALSMVVDRELSQRAAVARALAMSLPLERLPELSPAEVARFEQQARRVMAGLDGWVQLVSAQAVLVDTRSSAGGSPAPSAVSAPPALQSRPVVTGLTSSQEPGGYHINVVEPILRDGQPLMNVIVTVRPKAMQRMLDEQGSPAGWVSTLMDSRGLIVARRPGGSQYIGRMATPDFVRQMAIQPNGFHRSTTLDGVPVVLYYQTSPQGWTQVIGAPSEGLVGSLPTAVMQLGVIAVGVLMLALLGALWVARSIVRPIDLLKQAADRLGRGEPVVERLTGIAECDDVGTALAKAAQAQQQARATLEQEVRDAIERTREAEKRASHSQRVAALGRLTGGVAHDFNNLLGVVGNSAYLIQRLAPEPAVQTPAAAILRSVEAGSRLTQHLLRFAGRQPVSPRQLDLRGYLDEARDLLATVMGMRSKVAVKAADDTWPVTVDVNELELALINLALNARDAMPRGGELKVAARNAEPREFPEMRHDRYVVVTVSDTGEGVASDLLDRVFEPFFTTKAVGKGTGLGLAQVHGFCSQAGGFARMTSTEGIGTTVWLVLPVGESPAQGTEPGTAAASASRLAGRQVLLVEDNEALGDATAAVLQSFGCQVQRAASADQALQLMASRIGESRANHSPADVDLVLSDVVMPGELDGLQLARELRRRMPRLPIVLISGYANSLQGDVEFEVLTKPCPPEKLARALEQALDESPVGGR